MLASMAFTGLCLFADRLAAVASAVRGYQLPHYRRSGGPGGVGASIRKSPCFPDRDCRCRETSLLACSCLTSELTVPLLLFPWSQHARLPRPEEFSDSCFAPRIDKRTDNRARRSQTTLPAWPCQATVGLRRACPSSLRTRHRHRSLPARARIWAVASHTWGPSRPRRTSRDETRSPPLPLARSLS